MTTNALHTLATPALVLDRSAFEKNLRTMATARPGRTLRPHVKAHKCTSIARAQVEAGHASFTCATPLEVIGLARAGVGDDVLLANECLDPHRLSEMARAQNDTGITITVAVDSPLTVERAAESGITSVLIDVNVGLPRCGCAPDEARGLAELAMRRGLVVRGVMGYEGHLMTAPEADKPTKVRACMSVLVDAFDEVAAVGGESCTIISAGGTGTYHVFDADDPVLSRVNEIQAGSYALMDTSYGAQPLPFDQALWVVGTVISTTSRGDAKWAVIDVGLKSLGMDHGNPTIDGASVWFCSDEHTTFSPADGALPALGERVLVRPAHIDPTIAMHASIHVVPALGENITEVWPVDLRQW
jgi:D-serine deaminase-like pyridoxal phosphate-dependent protein